MTGALDWGMRDMHKTILRGLPVAALLVAATMTPASAADMYSEARSLKDGPAPVFSWTGFYLGGHVGGAWGDVNFVHTEAGGNVYREGAYDADGVFGGGQLGYNWQYANLVFGVEADLGHLDISGSAEGEDTVHSSSGGFYGDIAGRLGLSAGRTLFCAKGGIAFLDANFDYHETGCPNKKCDLNRDDVLWGWTLGGGVEYMLSSKWSIKGEYQHFDFGSMTMKTNSSAWPLTFSPVVDTVKVGVNYKFGAPSVLDPVLAKKHVVFQG